MLEKLLLGEILLLLLLLWYRSANILIELGLLAHSLLILLGLILEKLPSKRRFLAINWMMLLMHCRRALIFSLHKRLVVLYIRSISCVEADVTNIDLRGCVSRC